MLGFNMRVQSWIRKITKAACAAYELPSLFVLTCFSDFFFFFVQIFFRNIFVVFDLIIIQHVHLFLSFYVPDNFFIVYLWYWVEIIFFLFTVISIVAIVWHRTKRTNITSTHWVSFWHSSQLFFVKVNL